MTPTRTAMALMTERNLFTCQVEGCNNPAEEAHHVIFGNRKRANKALRDALNDHKNLCLTCRKCHHITGKAKSYENRLHYWSWACTWYGHSEMVAWFEGVPLKVKEAAYQ